jgi:amino acid transporter
MSLSFLRLLLGRTLANREYTERKIGPYEGVPAMGLDGLGSSSYGPEAALTVLIPLGAAGLAHLGAVMLPILVLLSVLYISYRQTIRAYPTSGGAYAVAKENLGETVSLLAAAALMIDYADLGGTEPTSLHARVLPRHARADHDGEPARPQTQDGYQSVVSQLAGAIVGHDIFYYVTIASLLCVLALSANTSFVGFPRLCRLVAQDDFLPRPFAVVGRRLVSPSAFSSSP